jgi:hypothetical protein
MRKRRKNALSMAAMSLFGSTPSGSNKLRGEGEGDRTPTTIVVQSVPGFHLSWVMVGYQNYIQWQSDLSPASWDRVY